MSKPAAIMGQLVDVRNIATHKCVRLSVDVPAEYAPGVIEAFGWATGVNPVPVVVARLVDDRKEAMPNLSDNTGTQHRIAAVPVPDAPQGRPHSYAQQAGRLCNDPWFHTFLTEHYPEIRLYNTGTTVERSAEFVRATCGVKSRRDILMGTTAGKRFTELVAEFSAWKMEPSVVP